MALLRDQIKSLRCTVPNEDRCFIPHRLLYELLTRDRILGVLKNCEELRPYQINEIAEKIVKGGRRVFAILVLLKNEEKSIIHFLAHDQLQRSSIDLRLPFPSQTLEVIVPDIASDFFEAQWELVAPLFAKNVVHRSLNDKIRLPFLLDEECGEGGLGLIFKVQLHPDHQMPPFATDASRVFIRKEFKRTNQDADTYYDEAHNLNLLNELNHPNIVGLLGSYTYRGKHNLLFPYVQHGDLSELLSEEDRRPGFQSDEAFLVALSQLSSAIEMVHDYTSEKLGLRLIGCHHDLKPKNILVNENSFILADFGFSTFKEVQKSSKSLFSRGGGHYLAPECLDYEEDFQERVISRPSDIWSFGCIIAEVVTYMQLGSQGVSRFKKAREIKVGNLRTYTFHAGRGTPNPGLTSWLDDLETQSDHSLLIQLVRSMLAVEPEARPKARQVTSRLRLIAVYAYNLSIDELYKMLVNKSDQFEADIEYKRFESWRTVCESYLKDPITETSENDVKLQFEKLLECLIRCQAELKSILHRYEIPLSPLFSYLRSLNDQLIGLLPGHLRERARVRLEVCLLETEDSEMLKKAVEGCENSPLERKIGLLATIKRMSILAQQRKLRCRPDLRFDRQLIFNQGFESHDIATIEDTIGYSKTKVLIEWVKYDTHWEGPVSEEMLSRVEAISELLNERSPEDFRALLCSGFFHEPDKHAFGLVFNFPVHLSGRQTVIHSLADVLWRTKDSRVRPSLGDRFRLAQTLATAVLEFHKVGWVHKGISAYNTVFFHAAGSLQTYSIATPYLIGFNLSRQDEPSAFTHGPPIASKYQQYHHPYYTGRKKRFRPDFDYYSLGIVLLEIGLWKTLDELTAGWKVSSRNTLQQMLLERRVPLLGHAMGLGYRNAVATCLSSEGGFDVPLDVEWDLAKISEKTATIHLAFESRVIESLARCSA